MERLDVELVKRGMAATRNKAKGYIEDGRVMVEDKLVTKPSFEVGEDTKIEVRDDETEYVGRGGKKLEKAFERFKLDVKGKVCIDIGASTGGFTECLLRHGAARVYAVDVGSGQLSEKLRLDERVKNIENTNIRYMQPEVIGEKADFICADLSFISLVLVMDRIRMLLKENGVCVTLIKPQFEVGRNNVGKKGVVKDAQSIEEAIIRIFEYCDSIGLTAVALDYSPIKGGDGNVEFISEFVFGNNEKRIPREKVKEIVLNARKEL
ncbi:MAG: TlyA family RNA methyltransferase [Oscillospiraceae bacterium]|nr:TlyA family RNA methyltransferase [Oscillospiraceae bacterium]